MTNYEKIKQMTVDEMAEWLAKYNQSSLCEYCVGCDSEEEIGCVEGCKRWLEYET